MSVSKLEPLCHFSSVHKKIRSSQQEVRGWENAEDTTVGSELKIQKFHLTPELRTKSRSKNSQAPSSTLMQVFAYLHQHNNQLAKENSIEKEKHEEKQPSQEHGEEEISEKTQEEKEEWRQGDMKDDQQLITEN